MATLAGQRVDRPAVCFYEINGLDQDPCDPSPMNVYSDPSWRPVIELARERTDRIVMRGVAFREIAPDPLAEIAEERSWTADGSVFTLRTLRIGDRTLTMQTRRDPDVHTVWTTEHLLKDADDLRLFLQLPEPGPVGEPDPAGVVEAEAAIGDTGIVMIDTPDPLCLAAGLFSMSDYLVLAMTETALFRRLLDRFAADLLPRTEAISKAVPGRLWRIYGPEYAAPPYLPPRLFREYVCRYVAPMVQSIQRHGGYARVHSHGRLRAILPDIAAMGADGLDPIEPPPQGDVFLSDVRAAYGRQMVLFGNLEASDLECLPTAAFAEKVRRAIDEGTAGEGRGFVLMPSSCPAGRTLSPLVVRNYEAMVEAVEAL
jgi:hypothetical protein